MTPRASRSFSAVAACSLLSAWCLQPDWSPEGNKLLFRITNESGFEQIHVLDLDGGGQPAPLQNQFGRGNSDAVWSADGKQILV